MGWRKSEKYNFILFMKFDIFDIILKLLFHWFDVVSKGSLDKVVKTIVFKYSLISDSLIAER